MSERPVDQVQIWTEADAAEIEVARQLAAEYGVSLEVAQPDDFVDPGTIMLLFIGTSMAVSTVMYLLDQRRGGQIVDLRPGANPFTKRDNSVAHGLVVIIATDGEVTVEVREPRGMFGQVMDAVRDIAVELVGAPQKSIVDSVNAALGERESVMIRTSS